MKILQMELKLWTLLVTVGDTQHNPQSFLTTDLTFAPTERVVRDELGTTILFPLKSLMMALTPALAAFPPCVKKLEGCLAD